MVNPETTLVATPNPDVQGGPVALTDIVLGLPSGSPSGKVTFYDGTQELGTATLTSSGVATLSTPPSGSPGISLPVSGGGLVTFYSGTTSLLGIATVPAQLYTVTTTALPVGADSLTATYAGSTSYTGSTSPAVSETVHPAAITTGLTSSVNPAVFGQSVTLTATYQGSTDYLASTSAAVNETVTVHVVVLHPTHLTVSPSQMVPVQVELLNYNGQPLSNVTATLWVNRIAAQPKGVPDQGNTFQSRDGVYQYLLKLPLQHITGRTVTLTIQVNGGVTALLPNGSPQILTLSLK
jgi:hypothetical protein